MSSGLDSVEARSRGRRPRDRKAQILSVAERLFCERGYYNVGTEDIAAAVGVTAGALYRHFRSKQDLLAQAITSSFEQATEELGRRRADGLDGLVEGLVQAAVERRGLGVLWNRESRHLDEAHQRAMHGQFFALLTLLTGELQTRRGELAADDAELLVWAILAVLTSQSYHATATTPQAAADVLRAMTAALVTAPLIRSGHRQAGRAEGGPTEVGSGLLPRSRRERLLVVSTRLFAHRGFQAVSMADIGAAAGVTATAVYRHFPAKADLLLACLDRAADPLRLGLAHALEQARTPAAGLAGVVGSYTEFALRHHDLLRLLISETVNLHCSQRLQIQGAKRDYVAEWEALLLAVRPELDPARARFLVHGAMTVVSDVARTARLRARPDVADRLRELGLRVLAA